MDDRGFERLRNRELRLTDDIGTGYTYYGGSVVGRGNSLARGDASFRPGVNPTAKRLTFLTETGEIGIDL
jgi:hypothetical protein